MDPILLDFPFEFETERLLIRGPLPGDGKAVYEAVMASLEELKPFLAFAHKEQSIENTEANIRKSHAEFLTREDLRLLVFHKETGAFIASSGLHRIDWDIPKFEIGYWIDSRQSGKGYMTEAVQGITDFAQKELRAKRIEIRCDANNVRSRAIPERLDFELEGILKKDSLSIDEKTLRDTCIFAKTF